MEAPLVSVIIPAYNHDRYIAECIQSIIDQTYANIELLIIDDGSTDRTWEKLQDLKEKCEKRFRRVVMERQKNQGTCITLNRLLSLAQGKYIYDIASDDASVPEAIEAEVRFLEEHPDYVLAVGNDDIINARSERIAWDDHQNEVPLGTKGSYSDFTSYIMSTYNFYVNYYNENFGTYHSLLPRNYIVNGYTYRRSALGEGDFFTPEAPLEDWYLMLQLSKAGKMKYIDRILYHYRWHDTNTVCRTKHIQSLSRKTLEYELQHCRDPKYRKYLEKFAGKAKEPIAVNLLKYRLYHLAEFAVNILVILIQGIRKIICCDFLVQCLARLRNELIMCNFASHGKYNKFGRNTVIANSKKLKIGNYCLIGNQCLLDFSYADEVVIGSHVQIGDNCLIRCSGKLEIGDHCRIMNGTIIDVEGDVFIGNYSEIDYYSIITEPVKFKPGTVYSPKTLSEN